MKIRELPILLRIDPKPKKTHAAATKCCGWEKPTANLPLKVLLIDTHIGYSTTKLDFDFLMAGSYTFLHSQRKISEYTNVLIFVSIHGIHLSYGKNLIFWIFKKPQVDPMDAHKNKHICILRYCFW